MFLQVGNTKIEQFNTVDITLKYDSVASTFAFSFYYDINNAALKTIAKYGSYARCKIYDDDNELLITGTILNQSYEHASVKHLTGISGYSVPGVLEDCEVPIELYPLQSDGKTLKQIAEYLLRPFGIGLSIDESETFKDIVKAANEAIPKITAEAKQTVKSYLTEIAAQKNIIIGHTTGGSLRFTRANASGESKYHFKEGEPNISINVSFAGQGMHSSITVLKQADIDGGNAGEAVAVNPYVNVYRPSVKTQSTGTDITSELAAKNALAAELKNISVTITIGGLQEFRYNGNKLRPNTLIDITAPECNINKRTQFFVQQVQLIESESEQTAVLTCVVPEVHNGQIPINRLQ
jgi:prophage tail gpP-like protein